MKSIFYHMALKLVWQFSAPPASFWCKTCLIISSFWSAPRAMLECATEHQHTAVFVVPRVPVEHWPCIDTNCMLLNTLRLPVILSQNVYFEEKMSLWGKHYSMYNVFWIFFIQTFFCNRPLKLCDPVRPTPVGVYRVSWCSVDLLLPVD